MTADDLDRNSPYHRGEQAAQERVGVRERAERMGRKMIRSALPDQHRQLLGELPFVVVGSIDRDRQPWASIIAGPPGFMKAPTPDRIRLDALPAQSDPLTENMAVGAPLGMLAIQPERRRRNRANGRISVMDASGFEVAVDQAFGNCPKYIQARKAEFSPSAAGSRQAAAESTRLSRRAQDVITHADTFFIATASDRDGTAGSANDVDVSHRGGRPGFVHVSGEDGGSVLTIPDFAGNNAFATFGNLLVNPVAGLLFPDFACGDILTLTGQAEILWDPGAVADFEGAQRFLRFRPQHGIFMEAALPLRWSGAEYSPQLASTGVWRKSSGDAN